MLHAKIENISIGSLFNTYYLFKSTLYTIINTPILFPFLRKLKSKAPLILPYYQLAIN